MKKNAKVRSASCTCFARIDVNYKIYYDAHRSAQADARGYRELEQIRSRYLLSGIFFFFFTPLSFDVLSSRFLTHFIYKIISAKLNWYILKKKKKRTSFFFVTFYLNSICISLLFSVLMLFTKIIISRNCMINVLRDIKEEFNARTTV